MRRMPVRVDRTSCSDSRDASCSIRFAGVQDLPVDVLPVEAGNDGASIRRICEFQKTVTFGPAALDIPGNADRIGVSERQRECVELFIADVAGDVSHIDLHEDTLSFSMAIIVRRSSL